MQILHPTVFLLTKSWFYSLSLSLSFSLSLPFPLPLSLSLQFLIIESQLALLSLVMTRCSDIQHNLLQLSVKLTNQQFALLIGSLYPTSLVMKLCQYRHLHTPNEKVLSPNSKLPNISSLTITENLRPAPRTIPGSALPGVSLLELIYTAIPLKAPASSPFGELTPDSSFGLPPNTAPVPLKQTVSSNPGQLCIRIKPKVCDKSDKDSKQKQPSVPAAISTVLVSPLPTTVEPGRSTCGRIQPLHLTRRPPRAGKCRQASWHIVPAEKKLRMFYGKACENCDTGTLTCQRCKNQDC